MSGRTEALLPHLPFLRRYARALTGSRQRGDGYVRACLESVLADQSSVPESGVRTWLFLRFHELWDVVQRPGHLGADDLSSPTETESAARRSLAALPAFQRQAFLLTTLEGFNSGEVAQILGIEPREVDELARQARARLQELPQARILVIEDEAVVALSHSQVIAEMGHEVAAMASNEAGAMKAFTDTAPDLILADVRLEGGDSGLNVVRRIMAFSDAPVIFVTGHPEDVLTGEGLEPTFVLEKPLAPETLKDAIAHALSFGSTNLKAAS